jgi:hypothetical protein
VVRLGMEVGPGVQRFHSGYLAFTAIVLTSYKQVCISSSADDGSQNDTCENKLNFDDEGIVNRDVNIAVPGKRSERKRGTSRKRKMRLGTRCPSSPS